MAKTRRVATLNLVCEVDMADTFMPDFMEEIRGIVETARGFGSVKGNLYVSEQNIPLEEF